MRLKTVLTGLGLMGLCAAIPAHGQRSQLQMLNELDRGTWELRERGGDGSVRNICLQNGRALIQLRHSGVPCTRVVVEDSAAQVTIQYTCHGNGYGRTQIRRETNSLIQVDTQGIANGQLFAYTAEGRRTGPSCRR